MRENDEPDGPLFLGTWLRAHAAEDPLNSAEQVLARALDTAPVAVRSHIRFGGFTCFAASDVRSALGR